MEQDYNLKNWTKPCPKVNCKKSCSGLRYVVIPAALGDDSKDSDVAPKNGAYCNAMVKYEANNNVYLYSSEGVPVMVDENLWPTIEGIQEDIETLQTGLADEVNAREMADQAIEQEIEDLRNNPDVVDIVGSYADLLAYDTSDLGDKDVIRVLVDETHDDESTYYRWDKPNQVWNFIGAVEGYYTKDQTDALLDTKQNVLTAGNNISIVEDTISAVDTTYTAGNGLSLNNTEFSVDTSVVQEKLTAGANISIDANNEISATDTTYTAGTGLDLTGTQFSIDNTVALKSEIPTDNAQLTNGAGYLTNTDYATTTTGGVIKLNPSYATQASSAGIMRAVTKTYAAYDAGTDDMFISKGTLENVITGKGLVDQTALAAKQDVLTAGANITIDANNVISATGGVSDVQIEGTSIVNAGIANIGYASLSTGGVVRVNASYGISIAGTGTLIGATKSYSSYDSGSDLTLITKGTLENVITGKGLVDQTDLATKQDVLTAGANIQINGSTISATDTTYSDFTGTDGTAAGAAGLVPAPATTDAGKFLKADGTWDTVSAGPTVVQTTGTSTTDVMSQNATTNMVFPSNDTQRVQIGAGASTVAYTQGVAIGRNAHAQNTTTVAIGSAATAEDVSGVAIGNMSDAAEPNSVALGAYAVTSRSGEVNVGTGSNNYGYNSTQYRVIGGVYDPQSDHDAATKGYVDTVAPTITLSTTDIGEGATLAANTLYGVYE